MSSAPIRLMIVVGSTREGRLSPTVANCLRPWLEAVTT
jgi:hypothetical protein